MEAEYFMQRCLSLAKLGLGKVKTNPLVGCVVVKNNCIVAEGYHQAYGKAHAEVNALQNLNSQDLEGAIIYVNLEPCSHFGKTPPCAQLLVDKGAKHVVIAMQDPNPKVAGKGIKLLKDAGIKVDVGLLQQKAKDLNRVFIYGIKHNIPYITLKWAESADGFIAGKHGAEKISNANTDLHSHTYRSKVDAILIGANTLKIDKPQLNARLISNYTPIKLIFSKSQHPEFLNVNPLNIETELQNLYRANNIGHILVEGGAQTLNYFIKHNLFQEIINIKAFDKTFEQGVKAPLTNKVPHLTKQKTIENNQVLSHYYL